MLASYIYHTGDKKKYEHVHEHIACADADACREGIGPVYWMLKRRPNEAITEFLDRWWAAWGNMIPVVLFNSDSMCDFSPKNRSSCTLESRSGSAKTCTDFNAGVVNSDFVYLHMGKLKTNDYEE